MNIIIVLLVFLFICMSIAQYIFSANKRWTSRVSFEVFFSLCYIYCTAIIGFAIIYFLLARNMSIMNNPKYDVLAFHKQLYECIYFSGVTMLTIGYGDIAPIGIGRFIAVVQALIGYILPTAFVLKLVQMRQTP